MYIMCTSYLRKVIGQTNVVKMIDWIKSINKKPIVINESHLKWLDLCNVPIKHMPEPALRAKFNGP